jgi:hypothetical protein
MEPARPGRPEGPLRRTDGVWSSPVHDRAVLYSQDEGKAIVLNPTGAVLWEALESPHTPSELAALLVQRFPDLSPDRALADVNAFLDRLLGESVLQPVS